MEDSPWEANSHSASQETPHLSWNIKVHYFVHKSLSMTPILDQINPVNNFPPISIRSITVLSSPLYLGLLCSLFTSDFPIKTVYAFLISSMHTTYPAHLIFPNMIILIIFGEAYNLWSYSFCSFLQSPTISSLLGPNIFCSTLFSNNLGLCSSLCVWDQVKHPYKTTGNFIVLYILICTFLDKRWEDKTIWTEW